MREGFSDGFDEGFDEGSKLGCSDGFTLGSALGSKLGCSDGFDEGFDEGSKLGCSEGFTLGSALGSKLGCSDGLVLGSELGLQVFPDFAFAPRQSSSSLDLETFLPPLVAALGFLLGFLLPLARATAVTAWFAVFLYSNTLALMGTSPSRLTIAIFNIFILWYQVVVNENSGEPVE